MNRESSRRKTGLSSGSATAPGVEVRSAHCIVLAVFLLLVNLGVRAHNLDQRQEGGNLFVATTATATLSSPQEHRSRSSVALSLDPVLPVEKARTSGETAPTLFGPRLPPYQETKRRAESSLCTTLDDNNQLLKDEYFFDFDRFTHDYYEYEQGQKHIIVRGRLRQNLQFWIDIGANSFVLDIIQNGYKLPLLTNPQLLIIRTIGRPC